MSLTRLAGGVAAVAFLAAGCGDPDASIPLDAPSPALTCQDDLIEIVELLRAGAPTYDYDPAIDLTDLTKRADVVVSGPIDRLVRGDSAETIVLESSALAHLGPAGIDAPASGFDMEWVWAPRDVANPLEDDVEIEGLEAIGFLHRRSDDSEHFAPGPQGLYVGCVGSDSPATNVLESLPGDAAGLSIGGLVSAAESVLTGPAVPSTPARTVDSGNADTRPLHQLNPVVTLGVDGAPLVELQLGFETWDGETQEPSEPQPEVGVMVSEAASLDVTIEHPARATITFFRLDEQLRFVLDSTVEWDGTSVVTPAPGNGTWFVDLRAQFGPSDEYGGEGVLRTATWLQVTPVDAECGTPAVAPAFSPDSIVTGVVDDDGCPIRADVARLDLGSMTPWFHCAPWPPILLWRVGGSVTSRGFWQYAGDPSAIDTVDVPADAEPTGLFLPLGEVLTAASDPDALFVMAADGTAQRWFAPDEPDGCD